MTHPTRPVPQPTDETGMPLTDAEIAAVVRARPLVLVVALSNLGHDLDVASGGMQVTYRAGGAVGHGRVVVARSVIVEAMGQVDA